VRLLDLIEQNNAVGAPADRLGQLATFLVPDVTRGRADEPRHGVLLHVLRHVDPDHGLFVVEEELSEGARQLGFPDTGGSQEDEGPDGARGILKPSPRPANRLRYRVDGPILALHALVELALHGEQLLSLGLEHPLDGDPCPGRHDVGDVISGDGSGLPDLLEPATPLLLVGDLELIRLQSQALGTIVVPGLHGGCALLRQA